MKLLKFYLVCCLVTGISFGQKITESENWLKGFNTEADYLPNLLYWSNKFTRVDIDRGKKRLEIVRQFEPNNEWEGIYYSDTGLGSSKFLWNSEGGYFRFFFYHELKSFDAGKVIDTKDSFEKISDDPTVLNKAGKLADENIMVKVKINNRHFLVPQNRLQDFCDRAAGLNTDSDFFYYWVKEEDMNENSSALPILPAKYKRFLRFPIETKIIHIGNRKIIPSEFSTKEVNYDDIHYPIVMNAGINKKLKKGMNFFVEDLGEWIEITHVRKDYSTGFIRRGFDERNHEQCWDSEGGSGSPILCKEIKDGMKAKTKVGVD